MRYYTLILTKDSSYFSGNVNSPFLVQKNVSVTAYILELPLARFKKYHLLFSNYTSYSVFVSVQIKSGNVLLLLSGLFISSLNCLFERDQKVHKKTIRLYICDKRNFSNIAADSVAPTESAN